MGTSFNPRNFIISIYWELDTTENLKTILSNDQRSLVKHREAVASIDAYIAKVKVDKQNASPDQALEWTLKAAERKKLVDTVKVESLEIEIRELKRVIQGKEYEAAVKAGPWC